MLSTTTMRLRPVTMEDVDNVHYLHSLPQTDKYNTLGIPANKAQTESLIAGWLTEIAAKTKYVFVIEDKGGAFAGIIGMNMGKLNYRIAEIWYKIDLNQWGKGYATDATKLLLTFGFGELNLHRIEAGCATGNTASAKVLEKCGFTKEGTSRKVLPIRGEWKDGFRFAILEEEFGGELEIGN